uniref:Cell surface glycoprotein MUC18-like n=1 Tax=Paramormyrops kingsleyae TaxID=1676925 RepID=A0A3B3TEE9_9TELE|nr:cell surface glycoprotein MUC18-like isoform X1 [Paramormyrops kingsleyae]
MGFLRDAFIFTALHFLLRACRVKAVVTVTMTDTLEVFRGNTVEIPCQYSFHEEPSMVMIQWFVAEASGSRRERIFYSDGTTSIADQGTDLADRISLRPGDGTGELLLTVKDVHLRDEREFICQVNGMSAGNGESKTQLRVFDPPEPPVIEGVYSGISVNEEHPSKIASCEVREGYPKPNISWYRDDTLLLSKTNVVKVVTLVTGESSGLFSIQSDLHYKVSKEDKDAHFHCRVTYLIPGGVSTAESSPVNITVHYPTTEVDIWKESPAGLVKEGDMVVLRCQGDGNPPPLFTFSRKQHPEIDLDSHLDLLKLPAVTREESDVYQCRSLDLDTYEEVTGDLQLKVHYMDPVVVVPKESEIVSKGDSLIATCNASSSLETSVVWFKDGRQVGWEHALLLKDVTFDMAGEYICEVSTPALAGLKSTGEVHIIVQGPPEMNGADTMMEMEENFEAFVNLSCEARGVPPPTVSWTVLGTENWREVSSKVTTNWVQSVVTVKVTSDITASCNTTNHLGAEGKSFSITAIPLVTPAAVNSTEGNGIIIVVIIVCILLLAILGSVLYFLYKKGKIPCGHAGKQDITTEKTNKAEIVVEMKSEKNEAAVLLKGVNGEKKVPADQGEKYMDVRN